MTLYDIKPQFQALLRPLVRWMAQRGITANQVTLAAALGSVALGIGLAVYATHTLLFWLLPMWMLVRMALNAVDGMLAREFNQQSHLGAYLNEVCDLVSDTALFLPFVWVAPFDAYLVLSVIFLALLSEFVGVMGLTLGASRRYDGPVGKSDRALVFGALGLWLAIAGQLPQWLFWLMPLLLLLLGMTIVNRVRCALAEIRQSNREGIQ